MTWFKVDETLALHPKVITAGNAAMGLWVRAGSWSSQQGSGGFVPATVVRVVGNTTQARALVAAGLWIEVDGGYRFHEWDERNPDAESITAKRAGMSDGGKRGNHERWHVGRGAKVAGCEWCDASPTPSGDDRVGESGANPPSRPVPSRPEESRSGRGRSGQTGGGSTHMLLSGHGLAESDREAFLAYLASSGVTRPSAYVAKLHQTGDLRDRIEQWLVDAKATRSGAKRGKPGALDVGVQEWWLR